MPAPVSIGGGWFDPHGTYAADAAALQRHEQHLAAEEFLAQKLLTMNYRRTNEASGDLFKHTELVQLCGVLEMTPSEVVAALVKANDDYDLELTFELKTHRITHLGLRRCPEYIAFQRVTS